LPHPEIDNQTPLAFAPLHLSDEACRPVVSFVLKGSFDITGGKMRLAEEQMEVSFAGVPNGEPGESSYRFEPETVFATATTDIVLLGHAHAQASHTTELDVSLRVGPVSHTVRVVGDRVLHRGFLRNKPTDPEAFERIPLLWEMAYGGWDRTAPQEKHHDCEPRNPVGVGFEAKGGRLADGAPMPNLIPVDGPLRPVGFGFVSPDWEPRRTLCCIKDDWLENRAPRMPESFRRGFFNAATTELIAPTYLRGDEEVEIRNVTPGGHWAFELPGIEAPTVTLSTRNESDVDYPTRLDTLILDADTARGYLIWRSFATLRGGPHDVRAIRLSLPDPKALSR